MDLKCPYHYPEMIQQRMAEDELPELLTLENLVEDYGVEPPEENAMPAAAWDTAAPAGSCLGYSLPAGSCQSIGSYTTSTDTDGYGR